MVLISMTNCDGLLRAMAVWCDPPLAAYGILPSGRGNHLSRGHRSVQQIRIAIEDLGLFRERLTGQGGLPFPRVYAAGNTLTFTHRETHYQIENLVG